MLLAKLLSCYERLLAEPCHQHRVTDCALRDTKFEVGNGYQAPPTKIGKNNTHSQYRGYYFFNRRVAATTRASWVAGVFVTCFFENLSQLGIRAENHHFCCRRGQRQRVGSSRGNYNEIR